MESRRRIFNKTLRKKSVLSDASITKSLKYEGKCQFSTSIKNFQRTEETKHNWSFLFMRNFEERKTN